MSADEANSQAVFAALAQFGAPVAGLSAQDFTEPGSFFRMGTPPAMVDILPSISGVEFEKAWSRRVIVAINGQDVEESLRQRAEAVFGVAKAATAHMRPGASIIATTAAHAAHSPSAQRAHAAFQGSAG